MSEPAYLKIATYIFFKKTKTSYILKWRKYHAIISNIFDYRSSHSVALGYYCVKCDETSTTTTTQGRMNLLHDSIPQG
jgi:hypothetical protein